MLRKQEGARKRAHLFYELPLRGRGGASIRREPHRGKREEIIRLRCGRRGERWVGQRGAARALFYLFCIRQRKKGEVKKGELPSLGEGKKAIAKDIL